MRERTATFLVRIGSGFIVPIACTKLKPSPLCNTPHDWIVELCHKHIRELTNEKIKNANFQTFKIEIEIKKIEHVPELSDYNKLKRLIKRLWKSEEATKIAIHKTNGNPSKRKRVS